LNTAKAPGGEVQPYCTPALFAVTAEIVSAAIEAGWLERNGAYGRDIREARSIGASSFANLAPNTNPDPDNRRADECPTWARTERKKALAGAIDSKKPGENPGFKRH
jgi:hypothetical protein